MRLGGFEVERLVLAGALDPIADDHLHVAADDMGRVIGKQGRIAKAIRTVMRAAANRGNQKIVIEID